jgi:hypothetical protein
MTAGEDVLRLSMYLDENELVQRILARADDLKLPNWYLGAGCIPQTVWNLMHGFNALDHIRDYDLTYFDPTDTSYEAEDQRIQAAAELFADLPALVEVRNQARVHLWYEDHFGYPIEPYRSVEEAIATWPTTASAIGVRGIPGQLSVYAPFGLGDVLGMVARPNRRQVTKQIYLRKVVRWQACWPRLSVLDWETEQPVEGT